MEGWVTPVNDGSPVMGRWCQYLPGKMVLWLRICDRVVELQHTLKRTHLLLRSSAALLLTSLIGMLIAPSSCTAAPRRPAISGSVCKTTRLLSGTKFGAMLDMLTDRCATMCLLVNLSLLYPSYTFLFQLSMTLDVASHWLHLHRCRRRSRSPKLRAAGG